MKKSILDKLREFQSEIKDGNFTSHFLVGIDLTEDNRPNASMMISQGRPFEAIGMIDVLIQNLKDTKEDIMKQLSQKENAKNSNSLSDKVDKAIQTLPEEIRKKVFDIKQRLDKAFEEQDDVALSKLRKELEDLRNNKLNDDDDDNDNQFNISDFKGGLA